MNQANFSAFTIGNHEFDGGDDMLANFLGNLTVPAVSTNIYTDNALLRAQLHPYLYYPEHEMALVALTTMDTPGISSPGNGTTFAPYTSVQSTVDQLLQSRLGMGRGACKRVIALTHIGAHCHHYTLHWLHMRKLAEAACRLRARYRACPEHEKHTSHYWVGPGSSSKSIV